MSSVQDAAIAVLSADSPKAKTKAAHKLSADWLAGKLSEGKCRLACPDHPGRPLRPELVAPKFVKRRRLGSPEGRAALLHAVAHIEFNAIDLAADMVARFGLSTRLADADKRAFIGDWIQVCDDEARHFSMICGRLAQLDTEYGDLPAHNGLWEAALSTRHDIAARLAIAPMVLEARGLDVTPGMISKLQSAGDTQSADILQIILSEEVAHVACGVRWFSYLCDRESRNVDRYFKSLLSRYFKGVLKPPFNNTARNQAGMSDSLYQ